MPNRYLLIDGNSIGHAANNGTPLHVGTQQVQAIFGFVRSMRALMGVYGALTPLVLWDGASWRKMQFPDYKANRDKEATKSYEIKAQAAKESFKKQVPAIRKALTLLGIDQIMAANMEADDLAGILV